MSLPPYKGQNIDVGASLENAILACEDLFELRELLYELTLVSEHTEKTDGFLRDLLCRPVPGLTCRVLDVFRHEDAVDEQLHRLAAGFLTLPCFQSEWYDETISAICWAADHLKAEKRSPLTMAYEAFVHDAEADGGEEDILRFCRRRLG